MSSDRRPILMPDERVELQGTVLAWHPLEEQFRDREQQHGTAVLGMWVFLATEVMFFGTLFLGVAVYHVLYPEAVEKASEHLKWQIGGANTIVLLVSSLFMVLAVHYAKLGHQKALRICLLVTVALGLLFLGLKGLEYYIDFEEKLVPGLHFDPDEWVSKEGLQRDQVPMVKLFLLFYWIMTSLHGLHVVIGIGAVLTMYFIARRGAFTPEYYTPVDVTALYWHFVDIVWIFLLPMLYLLGTHHLGG
jgi:cytochrome c oxidase subunit 3